jgi:hypothetical protein
MLGTSAFSARTEFSVTTRSQFAYPKALFLPPELIPSDTKEMESPPGGPRRL